MGTRDATNDNVDCILRRNAETNGFKLVRERHMFYVGFSVPPLDPFRPHHHERRDSDIGEDDGCSVVGAADVCPFVDGAKPDSARVTSSATRNLSSKATRSCAAFSRAAVVSSSGVGLEVPYAHEPTTMAAIVSPWATIRTRSQLFNERDWPLRIFVIAITRATVVAAAPTGTSGCCLNLRSAFSR